MCDCLVALPEVTGAATILAKNSDRPPDEVQHWEHIDAAIDTEPIRCTHVTVAPWAERTREVMISRPYWRGALQCWGAEHGVNDLGVAIGNEAIYTIDDPRSAAPGLTGLDLVRLGLQRGTSAEHAVTVILDLLHTVGQGGTCHDPHGHGGARTYWSSFLVADPVSAWVIETSARVAAVRRVDTAAAISNRTSIPWFDDGYRHPRQPTDRFVDARLAASGRVLEERPVTVDALRSHLASHDSCSEPGWSVCMHTEHQRTVASMVAVMPVGERPHVWVADGQPCEVGFRQTGWPELR
jgi:hypothetical protein